MTEARLINCIAAFTEKKYFLKVAKNSKPHIPPWAGLCHKRKWYALARIPDYLDAAGLCKLTSFVDGVKNN